MHAIVMYSGGVGSWAAGMRVVERYGKEHTTLLFCDTKIEDEDLYRFLHEGAEVIGVPVTCIADGRTPWEVIFDKGSIGGPKYAWCSFLLKQKLADEWVATHYTPEECIRFVGMDYCTKERKRLENIRRHIAPYQVDAPLFWPPFLDKDMAKLLALKHGLHLPRLYDMGFQHNNCGGFCVKAGLRHFANLRRTMPDRYRYHADQEQRFRQTYGKDVAILRDRTGKKTKPLSLHEFAQRIDEIPELPFDDDWQCQCFGGEEESFEGEHRHA